MRRIILGFFIITIILIGGLFGGILLANELVWENSPSHGTAEKQFVRVGISDNSFSNYLFDKVSFISDGDFTVSDNYSSEVKIKSGNIAYISYYNGLFEVFENNNQVLKTTNKLFILPSSGQKIGIADLKRKGKQALYDGHFELEISKAKPNKFAIVNVLPLQNYLKGVVPNEMPVSFGLEALKAQAVLARNYVLKPREKYYKEFDICDSTACQVYFGANTQEHLSNKAVDETENIVVMYDDNLILAVYSSTAGGYTESYKNVFMQNMGGRIMSPFVPYLTGGADNEEYNYSLENEEKMRAFYSSKPETFDNASPYFRWKIQWNTQDLEKTISKTLPTVKNTGFVRTKKAVDYSESNFLGHIKSIYINKRGASGKIIALTLITDKNEFTLYKELIIRKVFQYNNKILPSANVFFDFVKENGVEKIVATGGGLGHGVGMSQWGAGAMAKKGHKFEDIIHHYYKNVTLAVNPFQVKSEKPMTIEFYSDVKKGELKIENNVSISDLNIIINNKSVDYEHTKTLIKDKKLDISKYLKRGKNFLTTQAYSTSKKDIKFWIELKE